MSIETDYATLRRVLNEYDPKGWAVEFGVYTGYSLGIIAQTMPVIGFDSFEGLPEDWREGFPKGKFAVNVNRPADKFPNLFGPNRMLAPGWFDETVPSFPFPAPLGLVHIDCDLYSSTVTALEGVVNSIDVGTVIVFDEFHSYPGAEEHEERAFFEWVGKHDIEVDLIAKGEGQHAQESAFIIREM